MLLVELSMSSLFLDQTSQMGIQSIVWSMGVYFHVGIIGLSKVWNISKHGYIGTWILQIYKKYWRNIGGYFLHKYRWGKNYSKFMGMLEKTLKSDKISKNIHVKFIL